MLKEGYKEEDGKFYNAAGEEVTEAEATETPAEGADAAPADAPASEEAAEETKQLLKSVEELVDARVAAMRAELEQPVVKNINTGKTVVRSANDRMSKEEKFKQFVVAVQQKDFATLKAAGSTTSLGEVIPPTEFVSEVFRLEEQYGVAERDADVRKTDRTSITMILGNDDIQVSVIGEAENKPSKKLDYSQFQLTFRKGVGILPLTDEVVEDSAINLWNDATQRFARAFARKADEFVFTDATSGIVNQAGVNAINVYSINQLTFDDLNKAMYGIPSDSMRNGKFYFHRTILGVLQRIKDNDGRYILIPGPNGPANGTLWGRPYELTEVLPSLDATDSGDEFIVFGDLKYTVLGMRTQMKIDMSNSAVVLDPDGGSDLNSWVQDLTSMRAVKRFNAKVKFPAAYSVIRATNPVS
jgi:HK97 family phage major capsid protein